MRSFQDQGDSSEDEKSVIEGGSPIGEESD